MTPEHDLFTSVPRGMIRNPDHATSKKAAVKVKRRTIRNIVLTFAQERPNGFTDDDVRALDPKAPESSYRKRRTELADEGYILDSGTERMNSQGSLATVWIHRKFHPAAPPIKVKVKGSVSQAIADRRRNVLMFNALVMAAPHHQGGKSEVGLAIADALGIPFPIAYSNIPARKPV